MTAGPVFATGDLVEITAGMSKGARGTVTSPTRYRFGEVPVYDVRLETGYTRPIREDYLRHFVVPPPSPSDDDVCGTAWRKVTCP